MEKEKEYDVSLILKLYARNKEQAVEDFNTWIFDQQESITEDCLCIKEIKPRKGKAHVNTKN